MWWYATPVSAVSPFKNWVRHRQFWTRRFQLWKSPALACRKSQKITITFIMQNAHRIDFWEFLPGRTQKCNRGIKKLLFIGERRQPREIRALLHSILIANAQQHSNSVGRGVLERNPEIRRLRHGRKLGATVCHELSEELHITHATVKVLNPRKFLKSQHYRHSTKFIYEWVDYWDFFIEDDWRFRNLPLPCALA